MRLSTAATDQFREFVKDKKILIADACGSTRVGLAKSMVELGATVSNIALAATYSVAEQEIGRLKPQIVITDYDLGNRCGLDLLQTQRQNHPESRDCLFVLVTGNSSQSTIAQAAEEDVDTFILKPYTIEAFRNSVLKAASEKITPSDYVRAIEEGKQLLFSGKADEAIRAFERAMPLSPKPSLACFYHGQAQLLKQALDGAQGSYSKGLAFNKIHYKCMVGLYEVLAKKNLHAEAYEVVKRIARYFPANPKRLTSVLRLAILTRNYEDIERYYQIFKDLDARDEELIRYICAALVVCGKYYLHANFGTRALELFDKASVTAAGRVKVLREIIVSLSDAGYPKEAKGFLSKFNVDAVGQADYQAMEFVIADKLTSAARSVENGRALLAKGIEDPLVYRLTIQRSLECDLRDSADSLAHKAAERWPAQKAEFLSLLANAKAKTPVEPA